MGEDRDTSTAAAHYPKIRTCSQSCLHSVGIGQFTTSVTNKRVAQYFADFKLDNTVTHIDTESMKIVCLFKV